MTPITNKTAIVCFSTIEWKSLYQTPQAVMTEMANRGYQVLYIETTGVRGVRPLDAISGIPDNRLHMRLRTAIGL